MTQRQAHRFGLSLALDENAIDNIMQAEDPGGPQALKMFTEWRRSAELSGELAVDYLNNAIDNAYLNTAQWERKC